MFYKFDLLGSQHAIQRYGSLYSEYHLPRGKSIILSIAFFYVRRIIMVVVVVLNTHLIVQIFAVIMLAVFQVILMFETKPFAEGNKKLFKQLFDEIILVFVAYTVICLSDFVESPVTRF